VTVCEAATEPGALIRGGEALSTERQICFTASVSLLDPHAILDTVGVIGTGAPAYAGRERWLFAGSGGCPPGT
jgi:L-lysine exporter family protein LysE/ArgO